jgi:hypothetical protein
MTTAVGAVRLYVDTPEGGLERKIDFLVPPQVPDAPGDDLNLAVAHHFAVRSLCGSFNVTHFDFDQIAFWYYAGMFQEIDEEGAGAAFAAMTYGGAGCRTS